MARKPKNPQSPNPSSNLDETVRLDLSASAGTQLMQVVPQNSMETTQIILPSASAGTQMMQVVPENAMETTQIIRPSASAGTQMMPVVSGNSMETTQIIRPGASAGTQMMPVVPENPMETTQIILPGASAGTQMMQVLPSEKTEAISSPTPGMAEPPAPSPGSAPEPVLREEDPLATQALGFKYEPNQPPPAIAFPLEATLALPVIPSEPPPAFTEDPLATQALGFRSRVSPAPVETPAQPASTVSSAMPVTVAFQVPDAPGEGPAMEAAPQTRRTQPEQIILTHTGQFDSEPEAASGHQGLWLLAGAGVVVVALGLWYVADRKAPEPPKAVEAATPAPSTAAIPAPVPPGYQETLKQAQAGDVAAMRTLGAVYTYGLGVPPHREEGIRWYKKAAAAGSSMAAKEAKDLESGVK